jgi:hypothetical protein
VPPSVAQLTALVMQGEMASRLGTSPRTIETWRRRATGFPEPLCHFGNTPVFWWPAVEAWHEANRRSRNLVPGRFGAAAAALPARYTDPKNARALDEALATADQPHRPKPNPADDRVFSAEQAHQAEAEFEAEAKRQIAEQRRLEARAAIPARVEEADKRRAELEQLRGKIERTTATTAAHCRHKRKRSVGGMYVCDDCGARW